EYGKVIEPLPTPIKEFIGPIRPETLDEFTVRYESLIDMRDVLGRIADRRPTSGLDLRNTQGLVRLTTNDQGLIDLVKTWLADALEGVEADRIRRCPICGKIYWAGRKDQPACKKSCVQALRVRRWREKYQTRYKGQRIRKAEREESTTGITAKRRKTIKRTELKSKKAS